MQTLISRSNDSWLSVDSLLNKSIKAWIAIALCGQWLFAAYIFSLYALPSLVGQSDVTSQLAPSTVSREKNTLESVILFSHVLPAILMALSGLLQLFPRIRQKYPKFHRINGRMFFVLGISGALTGLYLTWGGGFRLSDIGSLGLTLNGILIPIFITMAWRTARNKQFDLHQRFAVHSFLLVNGVWSFRLYLMGWFIVNQGPNGNTATLDGPADIFISFACYLFPMAIVELYFMAKKSRHLGLKWVATSCTTFGAIITFVGVIAASMMMWFPRIGNVVSALCCGS